MRGNGFPGGVPPQVDVFVEYGVRLCCIYMYKRILILQLVAVEVFVIHVLRFPIWLCFSF